MTDIENDPSWPDGFADTVAFHGHLCLDIAMGFRVATAAREALGPDITPKQLTATVENDTCAVDAVQAVTGCTFGKRNLVPRITGKPVYLWQDRSTGAGVRCYVHFWETFDEDGRFRTMQSAFKSGKLREAVAEAFEAEHARRLNHILTAPATELFRLEKVQHELPPRSGGFDSTPCGVCGEFVKGGLLRDGRCIDCDASRTETSD